MVRVISGSGTFHGDEGGVELRSGEGAILRPGETHRVDAGGEPLHFIAVVAPGPGG